MNKKKIVSAISALAIAVSAFVSMAVTASAAVAQNPETDGTITWTIDDEEKTTEKTTIGNVTDTSDPENKPITNLQIGLDSGDSITDGVITYKGSSVKEPTTDKYKNLNDTNRYILVTAPENGDLSFKVRFTGGSQSNNRIFGQKVEGDLNLSFWDKTTGGKPLITDLKKITLIVQ